MIPRAPVSEDALHGALAREARRHQHRDERASMERDADLIQRIKDGRRPHLTLVQLGRVSALAEAV